MNMIESGGKVLDLGCGTGSASLELLKRGFLPFPLDASLEMMKVAEALLKIKARKISFDEIYEHNFYHAIWANFSLLYTTKIKFSNILKILFSALKKRGILFFSLKRVVGESRDKLGRFYSSYEKSEVEKYLEKATFQTKNNIKGVSVGSDGDKESWMGFFAKRFNNQILQVSASHGDSFSWASRLHE